MFRRLPYRFQIPLGLSLAVLITALLVTAVAARSSAITARSDSLATLDRAVVLLVAQTRPLLVADDTWRVFALLRDTAALIPGAADGFARLAVLDVHGRVFAASDPVLLTTSQAMLGRVWHEQLLPGPLELTERREFNPADGTVLLMEPIRSDDGQTLGFVMVEVESSVFTPDWYGLAKTALMGIALAVFFLIPIGWWVGQRMTQPVSRLVRVIERIGHESPARLRADVPRSSDQELGRISDAVVQLTVELEQREMAELRALSAERLAAVGRLTAAVAHEINNPLAGLLTATQTLRLHGESNDIRPRTLDLLERGLQQIRTTVAALLPQVRMADRSLEVSDLDDVVTLAQTANTPENSTLSVRLDVDSALRVPSAPMRQVMLNMLLNALKASGQNGRVDALLKGDAESVQFCVFNTGLSMTPAAFKGTLAAEGGRDPRGFGLWVCQELANHYGGGFELDPTVQVGTRLVFWLPNQEAVRPVGFESKTREC